jgi:hypothetical protein
MNKTPKELAEEWIETNGWNTEPFRDEYTIEFKKQGYVAGYQAGRSNSEAVQAAAPQWISVKDRLPEEDVDVVIGWFSKTASNKTFWTVDAAQLTNKVFSGWRVYPEVTHWMPLPKPPEDAKE